jgi:hypothetical protein
MINISPDTSLETVSGWLLETNLAIKPPLKQTVVRRGSSAFCCQAKVPESNTSIARPAQRVRGGGFDASPGKRGVMSVFARDIPTQALILMENPG